MWGWRGYPRPWDSPDFRAIDQAVRALSHGVIWLNLLRGPRYVLNTLGSGPGRWHIPVPTFGGLPGYKASTGGVAVLWQEQPGEPAFHLALGPPQLRGCLGLGWSLSPLKGWHIFSYAMPRPHLGGDFFCQLQNWFTPSKVIPPDWGWPRVSLWDATTPLPSHPSLSSLTYIFRFE